MRVRSINGVQLVTAVKDPRHDCALCVRRGKVTYRGVQVCYRCLNRLMRTLASGVEPPVR